MSGSKRAAWHGYWLCAEDGVIGGTRDQSLVADPTTAGGRESTLGIETLDLGGFSQ
ncbi:MAG TPA: hypothetical protein VHZ55_30900 [Bryobacteraceae bacterium]|nr:hypothetical protein [Bryobacteraceae bacterium]